MSTQSLYCGSCRKSEPVHQKLFDTLYDFSRATPVACPGCGVARELHINLDFQLGLPSGDFRVLHAFLPGKLDSWLGEDEEEVTLYPFLVVLQPSGEDRQFCWMPYWHVVGRDARFGQHALCLDHCQFQSLMDQVQRVTAVAV